MAGTEIPETIGTFWIPVAGIVPTIAIALVLEARLVSQSWSYEHRWPRVLQVVSWYFAGLALLMVEAEALGHMAFPADADEPNAWSLAQLLFAVVVVTMSPILSLLGKGTADLSILTYAPLQRMYFQVVLWFRPDRRRRLSKVAELRMRAININQSIGSQLDVDIPLLRKQHRAVRSRHEFSADQVRSHSQVASQIADLIRSNLSDRDTVVALIGELDDMLNDLDPRMKSQMFTDHQLNLIQRQLDGISALPPAWTGGNS